MPRISPRNRSARRRTRTFTIRAWGLAALLFLTAGCASPPAPALCQFSVPAAEDGQGDGNSVAVAVPGNVAWVDSGIDVAAGEALTLRADGTITIGRTARGEWDDDASVGPEGTYCFAQRVAGKPFPMPSAASGPAPCYCLIGRIGPSDPFVVGRSRSWKAGSSGRLYLGINDFDVSDNTGAFVATVTKGGAVVPVEYENYVPIDIDPGAPAPGCSVVVFYMDGLRPDVVREMAAMGNIPNINRMFVEGGAWMSNAVTGFPSDTITSNGTMWTGCFSDRHGLKGQVSFSRKTLKSKSYLDPLGPSRSARLLDPQGVDRIVNEVGAESVKLKDGPEASQRWRERKTSGVPPLYQCLQADGGDWATGALPIMTEFPPIPWSRSLTKFTPYLQYNQSWRYMDEANCDYAKNFLFERNASVTVIWMPECDSVSHHDKSRGQFGITRRTIARADRLIGEMVAEVEGRRRMDKTYFILCSDHGHHGGQKSNLSHFDLANEFFHRTRMVSSDGTWVGGGLGLSVRQHHFRNWHPGDRPVDFVWLDADADGAARVFLPHGYYKSGSWYEKPRPGDLLAYRISDSIAPVNLIGSLEAIQAIHGDGTLQHPVDLVLVKLTDDSILISTLDRGNAVIHRKRDERGKWEYKYTVVDDLRQTADGGIAYGEVENPQTDPLRLVGHLHPRVFTYYHDETRWLRMTAKTTYPDSVVAMTRHMLWQENLAEQEREHAPDFVVTAREGWYFGTEVLEGTTHGYPFADSMHPSFFVCGPNIRRGARIDEPCRLADLTPTILDMVGFDVRRVDFDGHPLRNVYPSLPSAAPEVKHVAHLELLGDIDQHDEADRPDPNAEGQRPVYWSDVDTNAWQKLPDARRPDYEYLPLTCRHPYAPYDMHNIVYDLSSISDFNVIKMVDDTLSPIEGGRPVISQGVGWVAAKMRHSSLPAVSDAADALDASTTTIGDYSFTSAGNFKRVDGVINWMQNRTLAIDAAIAHQFGQEHLPGTLFVNQRVNNFRWWFWDVYEFGERVVAEAVDEKLVDPIQDSTDRAMNSFRQRPAEMIVSPQGPPTNLPPPAPKAYE